jgi:hypothetical protein
MEGFTLSTARDSRQGDCPVLIVPQVGLAGSAPGNARRSEKSDNHGMLYPDICMDIILTLSRGVS